MFLNPPNTEGRQLELLEVSIRRYYPEYADLLRELHEASTSARTLTCRRMELALNRAEREGMRLRFLDRGSYQCLVAIIDGNAFAPNHELLFAPVEAELSSTP